MPVLPVFATPLHTGVPIPKGLKLEPYELCVVNHRGILSQVLQPKRGIRNRVDEAKGPQLDSEMFGNIT